MRHISAPSDLPLLEICLSETPDLISIQLVGELDMDGQELFERTLFPLQLAKSRVVLDLRELQFVDCLGIGLLVELNNRLALTGTHLELCGLSDAVQRALDLTGTSLGGGSSEWDTSGRAVAVSLTSRSGGRRTLQDHG